MSEKKIRVAIIDDHPIVLQGMAMVISHVDDMEIAGQYQTASALMEGLERSVPDILLMDINMPGIGGDELALALRDKYPEIRIIALTSLDSAYYTQLMMKRGAKGYILKGSGENVLLDAIRTVYAGEQYLEESVKERILQIALGQRKEGRSAVVLTKREIQVLQMIASNFSSQDIADKLFISKKTVENHRSNMLLKMKVKNAPSLIKKAIEMNLL